jgi:hypothetical protein
MAESTSARLLPAVCNVTVACYSLLALNAHQSDIDMLTNFHIVLRFNKWQQDVHRQC